MPFNLDNWPWLSRVKALFDKTPSKNHNTLNDFIVNQRLFNDEGDSHSDIEDPIPYNLYLYGNVLYVALSNSHNLPYLDDDAAMDSCAVGVNITDKSSYKIWKNATLCWDVLDEVHCFVNPSNLRKVEKDDAFILYDQATSKLKTILSLLQKSQELDGHKYFETRLPKSQKPYSKESSEDDIPDLSKDISK